MIRSSRVKEQDWLGRAEGVQQNHCSLSRQLSFSSLRDLYHVISHFLPFCRQHFSDSWLFFYLLLATSYTVPFYPKGDLLVLCPHMSRARVGHNAINNAHTETKILCHCSERQLGGRFLITCRPSASRMLSKRPLHSVSPTHRRKSTSQIFQPKTSPKQVGVFTHR